MRSCFRCADDWQRIGFQRLIVDNGQMPEKPQLHMIWPSSRPVESIELDTASGYRIRTYCPGDEAAFLSLMPTMDFDPWDEEKLHYNMSRIIPDGWFFAVETESENVVGTAMCFHNYTTNAPFTGDVGWLACDPDHRGHGLGYSLTACVTARFLSAGYERIQLHTEHYRLPAIRIYLNLGYLPVLYSQEMHSLWQEVCEQIRWDFMPDAWLRDTTWRSKIEL